MPTQHDVGWWQPEDHSRRHFFGLDRRSYCGKWFHMGAALESGDDHPNNCSACKQKRATAVAREAKHATNS